jgi:soluble lytic murein transglycosylase-like protein
MNLAALAVTLMEAPSVDQIAEVVQVRTSVHGRMLQRDEALKLSERVAEASTTYGVPPSLVLAVIEVESSYDPKAVSTADCKGLMQIHPRTAQKVAAAFGIDRGDNVALGTAYLASMFGMFKRWDHALMAFNKGPAKFRSQNLEVGRYARKVMDRYRLIVRMLRPRLFQS